MGMKRISPRDADLIKIIANIASQIKPSPTDSPYP